MDILTEIVIRATRNVVLSLYKINVIVILNNNDNNSNHYDKILSIIMISKIHFEFKGTLKTNIAMSPTDN